MGIGMGDVEIIDVSVGVTVVGNRPRSSGSISSLVNKCFWTVRVKETESSY